MWCHRTGLWLLIGIVAAGMARPSSAAKPDGEEVYPLAVLGFEERGEGIDGMGQQVSDLLFAELAVRPEIYLVERRDLEAILTEQGLSLSGVVRPAEAVQVGQLTGAKILLAGSVIRIEGNVYLVAKIIGTETSRVLGASVKGRAGDDLGTLVTALGDEVATRIQSQARQLMAEPESRESMVDRLRQRLRGAGRPSLHVEVAERHIGQPTIDPAAATELMLISGDLGFPLLDSKEAGSDAEVLITGEAFSEFAARHGDLISVRARVEIKAVERSTGKVLAADRQTTVRVGLSEQTAAKLAVQEATAEIAQRLLPKIATGAE